MSVISALKGGRNLYLPSADGPLPKNEMRPVHELFQLLVPTSGALGTTSDAEIDCMVSLIKAAMVSIAWFPGSSAITSL